MTERAAHLVDYVSPDVPVRQWVLTSPAAPQAIANTQVVEKHSTFSPDGRWIAYMANEGAQL